MARDWTSFSNHGTILLCIAERSDATMREIANCAGITERATQRIIKDLCECGYITRARNGRRNTYVLHPEVPIDEPGMRDRAVGELFGLLTPAAAASS